MAIYPESGNVQVNNIFFKLCARRELEESSFSIYEDSPLAKSILRCVLYAVLLLWHEIKIFLC